MSIYTRTGDDGTTSLFGGTRLSKSCVHVKAYGALDELTSTLGMLVAYLDKGKDAQFIKGIQQDLYGIMGFLANAPTDLAQQKDKIKVFEDRIDELTEKLPPLHTFIIPGGTFPSCWAHMARVSCRKAERVVITHFQKEKIMENQNSGIVLTYLNRLSDLLFTYARSFNTTKEILTQQT